mmetsp:Transcript_63156/g.199807  ORF Transcript_63156/g.199807 Transcript_63156/m.199807 type:complete len:211 (-) Transcript_63156:19-651(-)
MGARRPRAHRQSPQSAFSLCLLALHAALLESVEFVLAGDAEPIVFGHLVQPHAMRVVRAVAARHLRVGVVGAAEQQRFLRVVLPAHAAWLRHPHAAGVGAAGLGVPFPLDPTPIDHFFDPDIDLVVRVGLSLARPPRPHLDPLHLRRSDLPMGPELFDLFDGGHHRPVISRLIHHHPLCLRLLGSALLRHRAGCALVVMWGVGCWVGVVR